MASTTKQMSKVRSAQDSVDCRNCGTMGAANSRVTTRYACDVRSPIVPVAPFAMGSGQLLSHNHDDMGSNLIA